MKKNLFRLLCVLLLSLLLSPFLSGHAYADIVSTLYTVAGIVFSIGLGLISGFDLRDIKNKEYLEKIRHNIKATRSAFIFFFSYATFALLVFLYFGKNDYSWCCEEIGIVLRFDIGVFAVLAILFSIFYFVINFLALQKLRDQITDKILEESKNK